MVDWKDALFESPSVEHRDRVLRSAAVFLRQNAVVGKQTSGRRLFLGSVFGGITAIAIAAFMIFRPQPKEETGAGVSSDLLAVAPMVDANLDMLADLDIIDDLEVLENWEPS